MFTILEKIISREFGVFVVVQFKESTVQHIEVFIAEIFCDSIDISLLIDMHKLLDQIRDIKFP
jgi:hypothetical protein